MFPGPLRAFHEAVQAGSIRKASDRMGLAPSSVSRQIAVLEALMGTALFSRSMGGIELTHAGALVAEYARSTVIDFDALRIDLDDLKGSRGLIRVAMVESIATSGPVAAASRFRQNFEGVTFEFQVLPATVVVEALRSRSTDIGISFCVDSDPELVHEARITEPLVVVLHQNHAMATAQSMSINDAAALPLALPDRNFGMRRLLDRAAQSRELVLTPEVSSNSFAVLRDAARHGFATILPRKAIGPEFLTGGLKIIPLDHPELCNTTLDLIRLKVWRMPRIIRLYLEALRVSLQSV